MYKFLLTEEVYTDVAFWDLQGSGLPRVKLPTFNSHRKLGRHTHLQSDRAGNEGAIEITLETG